MPNIYTLPLLSASVLSQTHCSSYVNTMFHPYMKTFRAGCWREASWNRKKNLQVLFEEKGQIHRKTHRAQGKVKWEERNYIQIENLLIYEKKICSRWDDKHLHRRYTAATVAVAVIATIFEHVFPLYFDCSAGFFPLSLVFSFILFIFCCRSAHIYYQKKSHTATIKAKPWTK